MVTPVAVVDFFGNPRTFFRMTDDELARVIGRNVRAGRLHAKLSLKGLSERTGISVPHISRLEKGTHLPTLKTLKKVSDALEMPICSFLEPTPAEVAKPRKK
jgi:transcriptional regulator with XRE-family HTH domain